MLANLCRYVPVSLGKLPKESGKCAPIDLLPIGKVTLMQVIANTRVSHSE